MIKRKSIWCAMMISTLFVASLMIVVSTNNTSGAVTGPRYGGTLILAEVYPTAHFVQPVEGCGGFYLTPMYLQNLFGANLKGDIMGVLAKSWEVSSDAKKYTIHIFDNVTWSDGEKLTSADIKFTYEGIKTKKYQGASLLSTIDTIETPDDYTVILNLNVPDGALPAKLASWTGMLAILPKHAFENYSDWLQAPAAKAPIGCGPFIWANEWTSSYFVLKANPNYFRGKPYLDRIIQLYTPSSAAQYLAVETGEAQHAYEPPTWSDYPRLANKSSLLTQVLPAGAENSMMFYFNTNKEPWSNKKVREALLYGIDREELNQKVFGGYGSAGAGPYSPWNWEPYKWIVNPDAAYPAYNATRAEQLLDEAGYPKGTDGWRIHTSLITHGLWIELEQAATVLKPQLAKIGIDLVSIDVLDWLTWLHKCTQNEFDVMLHIDYMVPDPDVQRWALQRNSTQNFGWNGTEAMDNALDLGVSSASRTIRAQGYKQVQSILRQELPRIILCDRPFGFVWQADFHGFYWETGVDSYRFDFSHVWWEGGTPAREEQPTVSQGFPIEWLIVAVVVVVAVIVAAAALVLRRTKKKA